jgi:hypothetical protein
MIDPRTKREAPTGLFCFENLDKEELLGYLKIYNRVGGQYFEQYGITIGKRLSQSW